MSNLPRHDEAVIGACAHGHSKELDAAGFMPEWLESEVAKVTVAAMFDLSRQGKSVNLLNVTAKCRSIPNLDWKPVSVIMQNGYGDVDWKEAMKAAKNQYIASQLSSINREEQELLRSKPGECEKWLPVIAGRRDALLRTGDAYDPRPSAHADTNLPVVSWRSLNEDINTMLAGGYRNGNFLLYAGPSGHGKSTILNTHVADAVLQQKKVGLIRTENASHAFTAIMIAITGLTSDEIAHKVFFNFANESAEEREKRYWSARAYLEEYLLLYPAQYYNDVQIRKIIKWQKLDMLVLDYIQPGPGIMSRPSTGSTVRDDMGDLGEFLLRESKEEGVQTIAAAQFSGHEATKITAMNYFPSPVSPYGSSRLYYATDWYILHKRDNYDVEMSFDWVWKDREFGQINTKHGFKFNKKTRTFDLPGADYDIICPGASAAIAFGS